MKEKSTLGYKIKQINNIYERDFNNSLRKIGITSSQAEVLDYLFNAESEEISQRDIERALSLSNPTVTGILKRLEENGFIFTVPNGEDKRKKNIYPTEQAFAVQRKMDMARRKINKSLTIDMNKKEIEALEKMLDRVLYNVKDL
ncbi:MAG: MarR family transcriptional regulator [Dorea sp.]|nr:MarR family transcriptional regulator [Dorea sp.]